MSCSVSHERHASIASSSAAATSQAGVGLGGGASTGAQRSAKPRRVACLDGEGAHQHVIVHDELDRSRKSEPVGAARRDRPSLHSPQQRPAEAVFGARDKLQLERDASAQPLDEPKHLMRRREPELVSALAALEGKGVDYPCATLACLEGRLEDERSRNVATVRPPAAGGPERPVAGVGIEDSSEHGRAVEAGEAEPVDRAVPPDERGRVAVGEEAVLAHRCGCFFLHQGDRLVDDCAAGQVDDRCSQRAGLV
jgi:hypothetical protein